MGSADGRGPAAGFAEPYGVTGDAAGNLYVADLGRGVRKIAPDGTVSTLAHAVPPGASLSGAIAVVGASLVYATDTQIFRVPLP